MIRLTATHLVALGAALAGCQLLEPSLPSDSGHAPPPAPAPTAPARVELREVRDRPSINLVVRHGDPFPAVAAAVAHDLGPQASTALSALVEARVAAHGFPAVDSLPHYLGFEVHSLVESPAEAARFVQAVTAALRTPVSQTEPAMAQVATRLDALRARPLAGHGEAAVAECSGELGLLIGSPVVDPKQAAGAAQIERWRQKIYSGPSVAFSALGPSAVLDAATQALSRTKAWPAGPAPDDPWPARDVTAVDGGTDGRRRLSLALRVADGSAAIAASRRLARPGAVLSARLGALAPPWKVERVVGTTRPRGACVRIDMRAPKGEAPDLHQVSRVALLAEEEAKLALAHANNSAWTLDDSVLRPSDPRDAASVAAWRALASRHAPGTTRRMLSYSTHQGEAGTRASVQLAEVLEETRRAWQKSSLERRVRVEAGQGEMWALLASPCGTAGEPGSNAGLGAVTVRTLASKRRLVGDVRIEAWVSADGVGLLGHGARRGPDESPASQAQRIGAALGRVLVATRIAGSDVSHSRARLLEEIGPAPHPGWWLAVESLAPEHSSLLEPRGNWTSVSEIAMDAVDAHRRVLAHGPLRLAVLTNHDEAQAATLGEALERWLRPLRSDRVTCPARPKLSPRRGELRLETTGQPRADAYVGVPLPSGVTREAEWTMFLLNRPGGWLDRALRAPKLASSARAQLLGGEDTAALVIELSALDDQVDDAVAQVRGLLTRLASGAASQADAEAASKSFAHADKLRAIDPRHRVVELWHGRTAHDTADLASLRRFQRLALAADRHLVVRVSVKE